MPAISARDLRRPGIQEALRALEAGKASALVVAKLDRLSRSMLDFSKLMAQGDEASTGRSSRSTVAVDTSTPSGEAMANMLATFAQFERRLISQRTKEALAVKKAQGVRLGRPPTMPQAVVRRIQRQRARGDSLRKIADGPERGGRADRAGRGAVVRGDGPARPAADVVDAWQEERLTVMPTAPPRCRSIARGLLPGNLVLPRCGP